MNQAFSPLSVLGIKQSDEVLEMCRLLSRFKTERHDSNTSTDSSSIPPCQICREEFDSHQM